MKFNDNIEELLESLSLDELIGQMLCYDSVFSHTPSVQKVFVKAILGEIPFRGKTPVSLKGFF